MTGRVRPSRNLQLLYARARDLEDRRDQAAALGDRDQAHALALALEAVANDLASAITAEARSQRAAVAEARARPSDRLRGGRAFALADVPPDRLDRDHDGPLSVPGGTWARPVWSIDMDAALKFTAATYAAWTEEAAGGRQVRAIDPTMIRVDGGGAGASPETRLLWISGRIAAAHRALEACPSLSPLRQHQAGRLRVMTAREIIDHLTIEGRSLCEILALGGWSRATKNLKLVRGIVIESLDAITAEWSGGRFPGDAARSSAWRAEGAELIVGEAPLERLGEKTA